MPSAACVLAAVAALLFLLSLWPVTNAWPLAGVGGLILSIAVFLIAYR